MTSSADLVHLREIGPADKAGSAVAPGQSVAAVAPRWPRLAARQTAWVAAILIVILAALVVPPFLFLLQGSLTIAGPTPFASEWGLGNFETVIRNRHFLDYP